MTSVAWFSCWLSWSNVLVIKCVSSSLFASLHNSLTLVLTLKAWLVCFRWLVSLSRSSGTVCFPNQEAMSKPIVDICVCVKCQYRRKGRPLVWLVWRVLLRDCQQCLCVNKRFTHNAESNLWDSATRFAASLLTYIFLPILNNASGKELAAVLLPHER